MDNAFQYAARKLTEQAGEQLWPLAMIYFDPQTRGLKAAVLSQGAELLVGHGRKIGVIIEARARELCRYMNRSPSGSVRGAAPTSLPAPPSPHLPADSVESE